MANVLNGVETLPKISIAWVGCTNVTYDRQTTDDRRQTDVRRHIANMNMSSRSLKTQYKFINIVCANEFTNDDEFQRRTSSKRLKEAIFIAYVFSKNYCSFLYFCRDSRDLSYPFIWLINSLVFSWYSSLTRTGLFVNIAEAFTTVQVRKHCVRRTDSNCSFRRRISANARSYRGVFWLNAITSVQFRACHAGGSLGRRVLWGRGASADGNMNFVWTISYSLKTSARAFPASAAGSCRPATYSKLLSSFASCKLFIYLFKITTEDPESHLYCQKLHKNTRIHSVQKSSQEREKSKTDIKHQKIIQSSLR